MNIEYLDKLVEVIGSDHDNRQYLIRLIKDNFTFAFLRRSGYKLITFASGYDGTEIKNADLYVSTNLNK